MINKKSSDVVENELTINNKERYFPVVNKKISIDTPNVYVTNIKWPTLEEAINNMLVHLPYNYVLNKGDRHVFVVDIGMENEPEFIIEVGEEECFVKDILTLDDVEQTNEHYWTFEDLKEI